MNKIIRIKDIEQNTGQVAGLPANPRQWTRDDVERLARSIEETPELLDARPLIVIPHAGKYVVLGGNLRLAALKKLGRAEAPAYILPEETPVEKQMEIVIKDNGSFGAWDTDVLANEWDDLPLADWGVPEWVTDTQEEEEQTPAETKEDDFDENTDEIHVRCQKGDIWQLGDHRLMCGDSTDLETVKRLMGGALADMIFTDPPYGVSYTEKNEFLNRIGKPLACVNPIENDSHTPEEMNAFWEKAFGNLAEVTTDKAAYYITSPQGGDLLLLLAIQNTPFQLKHMLIWNKNNHVLGRCDYNYKHEPIIYGWKKKGTHIFYGGGKFKTTVWDIPKPLKSDLHPTMKPVELVANCILDCTKEGDSVIDVFGGSGTTLIAAEQLNRRCYMMELDPHYCDVIIARWEKLTGKEAVRISPNANKLT